ncbi:uncharacterized protein LOC143179662 [Calliopsis andreniformis]|uniref:uncharacterized protein LOC143179662 n=1 Tax=Calliopsis andreniformis TaxID=337506 RepID=UPI003FCCF88D
MGADVVVEENDVSNRVITYFGTICNLYLPLKHTVISSILYDVHVKNQCAKRNAGRKKFWFQSYYFVEESLEDGGLGLEYELHYFKLIESKQTRVVHKDRVKTMQLKRHISQSWRKRRRKSNMKKHKNFIRASKNQIETNKYQILCIACVVALRVTNDESRRVFHYLRSRSREWSLLNNITWGAIGAALATATCGGYIIITTGLLISAATGELTGRKTEIFFFGLGVILFGIVGALSMASIENVPEDLVDNAAVFGALCLLTALVFIADLLMGTRKKKVKDAAVKHLRDSKVKHQITSVITEKDSKSSKTVSANISEKDGNGAVNDGFEKVEEQHQKSTFHKAAEDPQKWEQNRSLSQTSRDRNDERENFAVHGRNSKEYTQNFENGRVLRDSQRYRDSEMEQNGHRDSYKMNHRMKMPTVVYKAHDIYQRPVDEVDTPRFPTEMDNRSEAKFAKIVNPGVKIMKVEHDVEEAIDYRYSDISQYDNVPIRMRRSSPRSQKKNRDVSFSVPPSTESYGKAYEKAKDEIEMLEECFGALRATSTGTQTPGIAIPSSPTDPGYVRHTASNWPQEMKTKTPGSSPNHVRI